MKTTITSMFALCIFLWACNNAGTNSTEKTDSSTTSPDTMNKMNDATTPANTIPTDEASSSFLVKAANGSMAEVQGGELAQQKGSNQAVRDFGAMMIHDHSAANDKVKALAAPRNVSLPATLNSEEQKMMDDLSKKTGHSFDKAYIDAMVKDHQMDIKEFEEAATKAGDAEVKIFITTTLPVLHMHLDSAKAIQKRIK